MTNNSIQLSKDYLNNIKKWFDKYTKSFINEDKILNQNIILKIEHTKRVCQHIINIGKSLNLNEKELFIAETIAVLHDIGRFEQFKCYRTFSDRKSVNHAELGEKIIYKHEILNDLDTATKELIIKSVKFHNVASLPHNGNKKNHFFLKLIRDADKLDIYKVVTDYYIEIEKGNRNKSIELDLPDTPKVSEKVCEQIFKKSIVNIKDLQTLNDFKLLQMGWIFDINFPYSYNIIKNKNYLNLIGKTLPETKLINKVFNTVYSHLEKNVTI